MATLDFGSVRCEMGARRNQDSPETSDRSQNVCSQFEISPSAWHTGQHQTIRHCASKAVSTTDWSRLRHLKD